MLYVTAEMAIFVALLATIYFPPNPPTPPSESATTDRTKFWSSLKALMCNRSFIVLAISGGLVTGGNRYAIISSYLGNYCDHYLSFDTTARFQSHILDLVLQYIVLRGAAFHTWKIQFLTVHPNTRLNSL